MDRYIFVLGFIEQSDYKYIYRQIEKFLQINEKNQEEGKEDEEEVGHKRPFTFLFVYLVTRTTLLYLLIKSSIIISFYIM